MEARQPEVAGRGQRRRGQALVEFAVSAGFLAMFLVGVVDFGRVFFFDIVTSGAAMEGARAAASGLDDAGVVNYARGSAPAFVKNDLVVTVTPSPSTRAKLGQPNFSTMWTTVTVQYTFHTITPLTAAMVGDTVTFTRKVSQQLKSPCAPLAGAAC